MFFPLLFVSRHAFEPSQRRNRRKVDVQFGVFRHQRLHEHRAFIWVESRRQPIGDHRHRVLFEERGVGVIAGQRVPVSDEVIALIAVLQVDPVFERAFVIAQVQFAGRAHTAKNPFHK